MSKILKVVETVEKLHEITFQSFQLAQIPKISLLELDISSLVSFTCLRKFTLAVLSFYTSQKAQSKRLLGCTSVPVRFFNFEKNCQRKYHNMYRFSFYPEKWQKCSLRFSTGFPNISVVF